MPLPLLCMRPMIAVLSTEEDVGESKSKCLAMRCAGLLLVVVVARLGIWLTEVRVVLA